MLRPSAKACHPDKAKLKEKLDWWLEKMKKEREK